MSRLFSHRWSLVTTVCVATLAAPASASAADCAATDRPDLAFKDANCDGIDGDIANAIFVDGRDGDDVNAGTRALPKQTIAAGIAAAKAADKDVYVSEGSYAESLVLQTDVGVYGGYAHGFATRLNSGSTTVAGGETAALADGEKRIRLQLLTLRGGDMPAGGAGSYALRAVNDASVMVEGATLRGGRAGCGRRRRRRRSPRGSGRGGRHRHGRRVHGRLGPRWRWWLADRGHRRLRRQRDRPRRGARHRRRGLVGRPRCQSA